LELNQVIGSLNVSVDHVLGEKNTISEDVTESLCLSGIHEANGSPFTQTTTETSTQTFDSESCFIPSQNVNNDEVEIGLRHIHFFPSALIISMKHSLAILE
jgi:hypothetical protein